MVTLGNPFDTMKSFCLYSQCSHLSLSDIFPAEGGCSEGLDAFRFFLITVTIIILVVDIKARKESYSEVVLF